MWDIPGRDHLVFEQVRQVGTKQCVHFIEEAAEGRVILDEGFTESEFHGEETEVESSLMIQSHIVHRRIKRSRFVADEYRIKPRSVCQALL